MTATLLPRMFALEINGKPVEMTAVVNLFRAMDQWTTADRHSTSIPSDLIVRKVRLHRHFESRGQLVPGIPGARDYGIAGDDLWLHFPAVYGEFVVTGPARNAEEIDQAIRENEEGEEGLVE